MTDDSVGAAELADICVDVTTIADVVRQPPYTYLQSRVYDRVSDVPPH